MDELFGSDEESADKGNTQAEEDLFGSDGDDDAGSPAAAAPTPAPTQKAAEEDLFGSDDEGENSGNGAAADSKQKEDLDGLFGSDDEAPAAQTRVRTQSTLSLPSLRKTVPAGAFGVAATMPSFVKIQPRPYVPGELLEAEEEEMFQGAIDMIRWRYKRDAAGGLVLGPDGRPARESNARMVKWSDGSFQLIVGSTVFQAEMLPVHDSYGYAQLKSEHAEAAESEDANNDATPARPQQSCLNSIGKIEHKVKILPSSVHSDAHTRMSLKVTEKYLSGATSRQIGYKHHATIKLDPEKEMEERVKAEDAELRKNQKRKMMESGGSGRKKYSAMSARYLEEGADDDAQYDSMSLAHLKRGGKRSRDYGSSGEDSGEERGFRRAKANKAVDDEMDDFIVNDEEEGGSDEYEEDESPQKARIRRKAAEEEDEDEDVFDGEAEDLSEEEEDDDAGEDADIVASAKGPGARSKRMIMDSDEDD